MLTLVELLLERKERKDKGVIFVESGEKDLFCSFHTLYEEALQLLAELHKRGISKGDYVVIQTKSNKQLVLLFWACILGGFVSVPLTYARTNEMLLKLRNAAQVLGKCHVVGDAFIKEKLLEHDYYTDWANFHILTPDGFSDGSCPDFHYEGVDENQIVFVQFSSGSTGNPKGVMLTHKNLLTNLSAMKSALEIDHTDTGASWLPLTHDMGMIGAHLNCVYSAIDLVLIDSMAFLFKPSLLFDKISAYQATLTVTPNFALEYMIHYYEKKQEKIIFDWDLSSLRLILCGAEPISVRSVMDFEKTFAAAKLRNNMVVPVYGLAEASLAVAFADIRDKFHYERFDRQHMSIGDRVRLIDGEPEGALFVSEGRAVNGVAISIRDEKETPLPDYTVGLIYIKGDSVTQGYINNPADTLELFSQDNWLNTNDIGTIIAGNLYVIGRRKEIIFLNGQNYYATDIERLLKQELGCETAVIGESNRESTRDLVYVFMLSKSRSTDKAGLAEKARKVIQQNIGIQIEEVYFVPHFPRTTSGKIRRFLLLEDVRSRS